MTARSTSVGHTNRTFDAFIGILRHADIGLLVHVRSFPRSRSNPAFNIERLPHDLVPRGGIRCHHAPALEGRRRTQPETDGTTDATWRVRSFRSYADDAMGDEFASAFDELVAMGQETRLAMMCSKAVWWRCQRRIITDHLIANGREVDHLMGAGRIDPASLTPGAQRESYMNFVYAING